MNRLPQYPPDEDFPMWYHTLWRWRKLDKPQRSVWVRQRIEWEGDCRLPATMKAKWPMLSVGNFKYGTGYGERESTILRPGMSIRMTRVTRTGEACLYMYHGGGRSKIRLGVNIMGGEAMDLVYHVNTGWFPFKKGRVRVWVDGKKIHDERYWFHCKVDVFGTNRWKAWDSGDITGKVWLRDQAVTTIKPTF